MMISALWTVPLFFALAGARPAAPVIDLETRAAAPVIDLETADRLRVQAHLQRVETELRARDVSHLAPAPRAARLQALDVLHDYRLAGRFPRNRGEAPVRIPIFIDAAGRTCAVAELMFRSGAAELAREVSRRENLAHVLDMHTDLSGWLEANGLTAKEAARIQPTYTPCTSEYLPVCASVTIDGGVQEVTFQNRCVLDCLDSGSFLHAGECTGSTAPPVTADSECVARPEKEDTFYAWDCRVAGAPIASSGSDAWLIAVLGIGFALVRRRSNRRGARQ